MWIIVRSNCVSEPVPMRVARFLVDLSGIERPENSGLSLRTPVLTLIHSGNAIFGRLRRARDGGAEVRRTQDTEALTQPGHPDRWFTLRARTAHTAAAGRSR